MKQNLAVLFAVVGFGDWEPELRLLFAIGSGLHRSGEKRDPVLESLTSSAFVDTDPVSCDGRSRSRWPRSGFFQVPGDIDTRHLKSLAVPTQDTGLYGPHVPARALALSGNDESVKTYILANFAPGGGWTGS
jgi:hypothetical protein